VRELVLVVDDDPKIAQLVALYLQRAGFETAIAADGLTALRLMREREPVLIVLDVMLPDLNGHAVAQVAREEGAIPILMLSALGSTQHRVNGLEAGADDYLPKPFAPSELVARVRSVLRRARPARPTTPLRRGELVLDLEARTAELGGESMDLSAAEFEILSALLEAEGRVLSRDQLIDRLRPYGGEIQDRSVDVYIGRLRAKLGERADRPRFVVTVRGAGYRLGAG
jgi:DNA-binding response OmpR family regulator